MIDKSGSLGNKVDKTISVEIFKNWIKLEWNWSKVWCGGATVEFLIKNKNILPVGEMWTGVWAQDKRKDDGREKERENVKGEHGKKIMMKTRTQGRCPDQVVIDNKDRRIPAPWWQNVNKGNPNQKKKLKR